MTDQRENNAMGELSSIVLPEGHKFLRAVPVEKQDDEAFVASYDSQTLFYDVFYDGSNNLVRMIGPDLRNLKNYFKNAILEVDGVEVQERNIVKLGPRTNEVTFSSPHPDPRHLRLFQPRTPQFEEVVEINRSNLEKFRGKNALVAISKNNDLQWIEDWLTFYSRRHGANAVVLIDNGSDAYTPEDIRRTIAKVKAIEAAEVISAPFPFGPRATTRVEIGSKFLHLSMLHIAHRKYLAEANAVLSVDIDELVLGRDDETVFSAVKSTADGYMSIRGRWRYARKPEGPAKVTHADHVLQRRGADARMQPKWCLDPQGPLAGRYWRVHGISGAQRNFEHHFYYLHCRQITTSWDYARGFEDEENFEEAQDASSLREVFGGVSNST
ncbi:hypothetical protein [Roseovarius atlanticus]|uniref:hypothetical protein n=1 Tax=Roseovarius atlanticus TaxID=1641875 RepID=UPI001C938566|nr:hypothetical protein [Roseovarius atlanticus]MBY5989896.1 hypothetical protein [Roseovarius atlanticus]MBY6126441.1 hypothetical protein [Roseovarius atlanticus]MBY6150935.1 hypothetical protein [Roseovarius atlanticus]